MANNEIIAKCEEIDLILSGFAKEIGSFSNDMGQRANDVMATVTEIGTKWQGNGYVDFRNNMGDKIQNIENSLESCNVLKTKLEEKSRQMKEVLIRLRDKEK